MALNTYQFKKIIAVEDFEVENSVLELEIFTKCTKSFLLIY
jgi:hypothetical protein